MLQVAELIEMSEVDAGRKVVVIETNDCSLQTKLTELAERCRCKLPIMFQRFRCIERINKNRIINHKAYVKIRAVRTGRDRSVYLEKNCI